MDRSGHSLHRNRTRCARHHVITMQSAPCPGRTSSLLEQGAGPEPDDVDLDTFDDTLLPGPALAQWACSAPPPGPPPFRTCRPLAADALPCTDSAAAGRELRPEGGRANGVRARPERRTGPSGSGTQVLGGAATGECAPVVAPDAVVLVRKGEPPAGDIVAGGMTALGIDKAVPRGTAGLWECPVMTSRVASVAIVASLTLAAVLDFGITETAWSPQPVSVAEDLGQYTCAAPSDHQSEHRENPAPLYVYRVDTRSPEQVKAAGGFSPMTDPDSLPLNDPTKADEVQRSLSLDLHQRGGPHAGSADTSVYVATTTSEDNARRFGQTYLGPNTNMWVYKIKTGEMFIDVNRTLGTKNAKCQEWEFAAFGKISWSRVESHRKMRSTGWVEAAQNASHSLTDRLFRKHGKELPGGPAYGLAGWRDTNADMWNREPWKRYNCAVPTHVRSDTCTPKTSGQRVTEFRASRAEWPVDIAMGDSYISGEGGRWVGNQYGTPSQDQRPGTSRNSTLTVPGYTGTSGRTDQEIYPQSWTDNRGEGTNPGCHRSDEAEISYTRNYGINLACSGAGTNHLTGDSLKGEEAQITQLESLLAGEDAPTPRTVVISAGGNDLDLRSYARDCAKKYFTGVFEGTCTRSMTSHPLFDDQYETVKNGLLDAVRRVKEKLHAKGHTGTRIVLQSYPYPLPPSGKMRTDPAVYGRYSKLGCPFDGNDADAMRLVADNLNRAVLRAAAAADVSFLDMRNATDGHELCSTEAQSQTLPEAGKAGQDGAVSAGKLEWIRWVDGVDPAGIKSLLQTYHKTDTINADDRPADPQKEQESLHPNNLGIVSMAACLTHFLSTATDPAVQYVGRCQSAAHRLPEKSTAKADPLTQDWSGTWRVGISNFKLLSSTYDCNNSTSGGVNLGVRLYGNISVAAASTAGATLDYKDYWRRSGAETVACTSVKNLFGGTTPDSLHDATITVSKQNPSHAAEQKLSIAMNLKRKKYYSADVWVVNNKEVQLGIDDIKAKYYGDTQDLARQYTYDAGTFSITYELEKVSQ
jgi:hypothetical protein